MTSSLVSHSNLAWAGEQAVLAHLKACKRLRMRTLSPEPPSPTPSPPPPRPEPISTQPSTSLPSATPSPPDPAALPKQTLTLSPPTPTPSSAPETDSQTPVASPTTADQPAMALVRPARPATVEPQAPYVLLVGCAERPAPVLLATNSPMILQPREEATTVFCEPSPPAAKIGQCSSPRSSCPAATDMADLLSSLAQRMGKTLIQPRRCTGKRDPVRIARRPRMNKNQPLLPV